MENIQQIETSKLKRHPNNPRKDYRDIDELAESIKARGVLQNLTVIPDPNEEGTYFVVIGNRRHMAAQQAGVLEVPCVVTEMDERTQASTMLLENMQRDGLTVYEQANGFQMCLDLGMTEETIVRKTGFSKTTVHHRLNIAKLDQKLLKKKGDDEAFQLTLKDLYTLEKVKDIKARNKILKEARDSRDLSWRAERAASDAEKKKKMKQIAGMLKKIGLEEAPKSAENEQYSGKWEIVKEISLDKDVPKKIKLKEIQGVYYLPCYRTVRIIKKVKKGKKVLTPEEEKQREVERNKKAIKAKIKDMNASCREFVLSIISGKIEAVKDKENIKEQIWNFIVDNGCYLSQNNMSEVFTEKSIWECEEDVREETEKKVKSLSFIHSMFIAMHYTMVKVGDIYDWCGRYNSEIGAKLLQGYEILKPYGWTFANSEEEQLLNGTHQLYSKAKEE